MHIFALSLISNTKTAIRQNNSINEDKASTLSDLKRGDLLVDSSEKYFAVFLGNQSWLIESQKSQKISVLKAPFEKEPIQSMKVDIFRPQLFTTEQGTLQQSSQSQ